MSIRVAALLFSMLLLGCVGSSGEEPRIVFEKFTLNDTGTTAVVFRIENRRATPIEYLEQHRFPVWLQEVPDASEEDGWGWPEYVLFGCGVGQKWTALPPGGVVRYPKTLFEYEVRTFRMTLRARRPTLARRVGFDIGDFDTGGFAIKSDVIPYPWRLDALGEGVVLDEDDLVRAVFLGDDAKVRALLARGVPAHRPDPDTGATPLHAAAAMGKPELARILLDAGAPVDATAAYDRTPLWWAIDHRQFEMVRVLLEAGADPDHHGPGSMTPLAYVERQKSDAIAEILRSAGARR